MGLVHCTVITYANVYDKHPLADLLGDDEKCVCGDRDYQGCPQGAGWTQKD
mgnify:FL=1